jgi:hypothetical protein
MRPSDDLSMVCFHAERQGRLARCFRSMPVARVVLDAPYEQRNPSGENEDLAVLFQGDALTLQGCDAAKPCPALYQELIGWHERVLGTKPVSHDPQAFKRRLVQVRPLKAAH